MSVTLVVIFNHKFNKNIPILRELYGERFRKIRFLVPFYEGNDDDVIPVCDSSYQFQGYITQAYKTLKDDDASHFLFIGDDLILAPFLNENNILDYLGVGEKDAYIESITSLKKTDYWYYSRFQSVHDAFHQVAVNYKNEIPNLQFFEKKALEFGIGEYKIDRHVKCKKYGWKHVRLNVNRIFNTIVNPIEIEYPLATGYSDFFVLPSEKLKEFSRLSGVFAAMRLFVETAIPTALMLTMDKQTLKTQKDAKLYTKKLWWHTETARKFEEDCQYKVSNMDEFWPEKYAYLHPIKLSRWEK